MPHFDRYGTSGGLSRNAVIAVSVVLLHVAGLWAMQSGLLRKTAEVIIPVQVLSQFLTPPAPPAPPAPPPPKPQAPKPKPEPAKPRPPKPRPAPAPAAVPDLAPAPTAPVGVVEPQPPAPPITTAPSAPTPAPPAPPKLVQPSSNASHLNNPAPAYPAVSRRLGEQGVVTLNVLIGTDGLPKKVEVKKSSGFERLDRQAVDTVLRWRFVPGTRNGMPEAMWYLQPIHFVLTQ